MEVELIETPLKRERIKSGISIRELARRVSTSPSEILRLEKGERLGTLFVWCKLWNYFNWSVEEFTDIIYEHYTMFKGMEVSYA